jgi:hypothetical protein
MHRDNHTDVPIASDHLEFKGVEYDLDMAIRNDKELITINAERSHGKEFDELYDKESIRPDKVRVFTDKDGEPVFGMVIYVIKYKTGDSGRYACGNYYPFYKVSLDKNFLMPHPFQASICW